MAGNNAGQRFGTAGPDQIGPENSREMNAWLANRTPAEREQLRLLALEAGSFLRPDTVLRTLLLTGKSQPILEDDASTRSNIIQFSSSNHLYVLAVTSTVRGPKLVDGAFDEAFGGALQPTDYIDVKIETDATRTTSDWVPLSECSYKAQEPYWLPLWPMFLPAKSPLSFEWRANEKLASADSIHITLHCKMFPNAA